MTHMHPGLPFLFDDATENMVGVKQPNGGETFLMGAQFDSSGAYVPNPTSEAAHAAQHAGMGLGKRAVAGAGDSLVAGAYGGASPYNKSFSRNNASFQNVGNFAVGGTRTDQIASQIAPAIAAGAKTIVIDGGVNDIIQSVPEATLQANWIANIKAIQNAGARPIDQGIPPTNTAGVVPRYMAHEVWRKLYCYKNGIQHADIYTPLATASGGWRSGYNGDVTHYNSVGAYYAEKALTPHILSPYTPSMPLLAMTDTASDSGTFLGNAVSFSNSGGLPTGWFSSGSGGTYSVTAADAGDLGAWLRCTMTGGTSVGFTPTAATLASLGWNVGDKLAIGFRIRWGDTGGALALQSYVTGVTISGSQPLFNELGGPTGDSVYVYGECSIASGTVININFLGTGTGWFEVNRPIIVNLTKLGLA